ncbi:MAG: hypothetical protein V7678_06145 [Brevundimonas sp.]
MGEHRRFGRVVVSGLCLFLLAACERPPMSAEDQAFDERLNRLLRLGGPIDLADVEPGTWTTVCGVGEDQPRDLLPEVQPRAGEMAMDHLFDVANTMFGPTSALVFVHGDGAEIRPVSDLHIDMGYSPYGCVARADGVLVRREGGGWRFSNHPEAF